MKKIFASLAAGLIIASAVPAMAAEAGNRVDNDRPGYCWQSTDQSDDGYYCGRHHRGGRGGCYWGNQQNSK